MQFSDTSNLTGIVEDIDFWCQSDATSYPLKDKARNASRWQYDAWTWMIMSNGFWQVDDRNNTDLPIITTDLVATQQDYALPADLLRIQAVEVKDAGGSWVRLRPIDQSSLSKITDYRTSDGMPKEYDIRGNSIFLEPAPAAASVTTTAGLKLYVSREGDDFASTDTTQQPGLPENGHRILSLGASHDWLLVHGTAEQADRVHIRLQQEIDMFIKFWGDANEEVQVRMVPYDLRNRSDYY